MNWKKLVYLKNFYNKTFLEKGRNNSKKFCRLEAKNYSYKNINNKTLIKKNFNFLQKLPVVQNIKYYNQCFDKGRLKNFVLWFLLTYGENRTVHLVEKLKNIGFQFASKAGISLGIEDLKIPPKKTELIFEAEKQTFFTENQYLCAEITGVERFQRLINIWHKTSELLKQEVIDNFEKTDLLNPVYMMAFSGARGNMSQVRQLVGMRGLMANPQGQIIDFPIRSNFREGLTLTEYIISSYGARKGIVDTALRTANAGYLTRRLVDVAQQVMISNFDCGTHRGIFLMDMKEGNKTIHSLTQRMVGRILARDTLIALRNDEITMDLAFEMGKKLEKVFVRSPLTCETSKFICQLCYGWSLAQGRLVSIGEAVGVVAAQSIGEPGTQLTMRTFHTGGVFSADLYDQISAPFDGIVEYISAIPGNIIRTLEGEIAFITKNEGSFIVRSLFNKNPNNVLSSKKFKIPSYTILFVRNGQKVYEKDVIAQITSFGQNVNITDNAEYTIQAKLEGQFYSKTLRFREKDIGPYQFNKNLKTIKNNSNFYMQFLHNAILPNDILATMYNVRPVLLPNRPFFAAQAFRSTQINIARTVQVEKNLPKRRKYAKILDIQTAQKTHSQTYLNNEALKKSNTINIVTPVLSTYNKIEKLYEAWTWGFAWILSGKIYELNFNTPFFAKIGDFLNLKSCLTQTLWKIKSGFAGNIVEYPLQSKMLNVNVLNNFYTSNNFISKFNNRKNFKTQLNITTPPFILQPILNLNIEKITFKKFGYFLKFTQFFYTLKNYNMYIFTKYIHNSTINKDNIIIKIHNKHLIKGAFSIKNKHFLYTTTPIGLKIYKDFYNYNILNLSYNKSRFDAPLAMSKRYSILGISGTVKSLNKIHIFNNYLTNQRENNTSDIIFSSKSMHNTFNKSGYLSFIKKQQNKNLQISKKSNFATKFLWFPLKTQTSISGYTFIDYLNINKNPLTGNTILYIYKKNQTYLKFSNKTLILKTSNILKHLYKKVLPVSKSLLVANFGIYTKNKYIQQNEFKNFKLTTNINFYYKPMLQLKKSLCTIITKNKSNTIFFTRIKNIKTNTKINFLKKFKSIDFSYLKKNSLFSREILFQETNKYKNYKYQLLNIEGNSSYYNDNLKKVKKNSSKVPLTVSKNGITYVVKTTEKYNKNKVYFLTHKFLMPFENQNFMFGMKWKNSFFMNKKVNTTASFSKMPIAASKQDLMSVAKNNHNFFNTIYWIPKIFNNCKTSKFLHIKNNKTLNFQKTSVFYTKGSFGINYLIYNINRQGVYKSLNFKKKFINKNFCTIRAAKNAFDKKNKIFISPLYIKNFFIKKIQQNLDKKTIFVKFCTAFQNCSETKTTFSKGYHYLLSKHFIKIKINNINVNYSNIPLIYISKYIKSESLKIYGINFFEKLCYFMTASFSKVLIAASKNFIHHSKKWLYKISMPKISLVKNIYYLQKNTFKYKFLQTHKPYFKNLCKYLFYDFIWKKQLLDTNNIEKKISRHVCQLISVNRTFGDLKKISLGELINKEKIKFSILFLQKQKINILNKVFNKICTQYHYIYFQNIIKNFFIKIENNNKNWVYIIPYNQCSNNLIKFFMYLHKKLIAPGQIFSPKVPLATSQTCLGASFSSNYNLTNVVENICFDTSVSLFFEFNYTKGLYDKDITHLFSTKTFKNLKWIKNKNTRFFFINNTNTLDKNLIMFQNKCNHNLFITLNIRPVDEFNLIKETNLKKSINLQMIYNSINLFKLLFKQEKWIKYNNIQPYYKGKLKNLLILSLFKQNKNFLNRKKPPKIVNKNIPVSKSLRLHSRLRAVKLLCIKLLPKVSLTEGVVKNKKLYSQYTSNIAKNVKIKNLYINKSYDSYLKYKYNKTRLYNKQEKTSQPLSKNPTCNFTILSNGFINTIIKKINIKNLEKCSPKMSIAVSKQDLMRVAKINTAMELLTNKNFIKRSKKFIVSLKPINFSTFFINYTTPYVLNMYKQYTYSYTYKSILNFEKKRNPQFAANMLTILNLFIQNSIIKKEYLLKKEKNLTKYKSIFCNTLISKIYQCSNFSLYLFTKINKIKIFDNKQYLLKFLYSLNNQIHSGHTIFKSNNLSPFIGEIVYMKNLQKSMFYVSEIKQPFVNKNLYLTNCMFLTKKDIKSFYISSQNFTFPNKINTNFDESTFGRQNSIPQARGRKLFETASGKQLEKPLVQKYNKNKKYSIDNIFVKQLITTFKINKINNEIKKTFIEDFLPHTHIEIPSTERAVQNNKFKVKISKLAAGTPYSLFNNLLGEFFLNGHQISQKTTITISGQIIHYNNQKITLRHSQPIFISPKGVLHKFDGDYIDPKTPVITLSYQRVKTGDIIQGIPKVEQFFEARTTKRGRLFRDSIPTLLKAIFKHYKSKLPLKQAVRQSFYKIQQILVDGVQRVYKSQGVTIADKHLEVIVKQMTSKVCIIDGAQTGFFPGEIVELFVIEKINKFLIQKITYEPLVLGITRASLEVDSFLSAASFQQTSKVLSKAAIYRKKDYLKGLKENVILGNLIPTGTGFLTNTIDQQISK